MTAPFHALSELQAVHASAKNANTLHQQALTPLEHLALFVTEKVGTMGFFFIIFGWTIVWLGWNMFGPGEFRFDPFPGFVLWLFISNLIQIHLMPLIMIGQNLQNRHAELRAEQEFVTAKKAEAEIETILLHLEQQQHQLDDILKRLK